MRKVIEVTEEVIAQAVRADSSHCMIADAIHAACPAWTHVSVDLQTIRVTEKATGQRLIWLTPPLLQQQLLRFDQGEKVEPWSFRMPNTVSQIIKLRQSRPKPEPAMVEVKPGRHAIPTIRGGKEPPAAVLSNTRGRRRIFGIRAARGFDPAAAG